MKLEDLFVKQRPPKDYVTYPPQETPNLETFLAQRTNPPSPVVGQKMAPLKVPKEEEAPIPEPELQEMKTAYAAPIQDAPAPSESSSTYSKESQSTSSQYPAPINYDLDQISGLVDKLAPKSSMSDIIPALVPAAMDLLSGGYGQGYKIAGDYLVGDIAKKEARKQTLENMILGLEKSRMSAEAKRKLAGTSAEDGRQARFEAAQKEKRSLADRQVILDTRNKLNQDKSFVSSKARYNATNDAINVLNKKSWAGDAGAGFLFAKGIFGEVGSLTNEERSAFIANPLLENKFNFLYSKYLKNGTFTDQDRADLISLAAHMRERAKQDMHRVANSYIEGARSVGVDPSGMINPLLRMDDIKYDTQPSVKSELPAIKYGKDKEGNMYKLKLNPKTGKYDYAD